MFLELSLFGFYSGQLSRETGGWAKGFRCCTIGLRLFRVYSASVSELDAGERAAKAAATALAVSWSMKIDQCIVLRDTSKATILPSNFPVFQSWNQHIFPYTSFSVWKTSSDYFPLFFSDRKVICRDSRCPALLSASSTNWSSDAIHGNLRSRQKKKRKVEQQTTDIFFFYLYNN
jgi:hypothetical protein